MDRQGKRKLLFILLVVLLEVIGFGIVLPIFPTLLMELGHTNLSEAAVIGGYLLFIYALLLFTFGPVMGGLSDRFGRRPVILVSLFAISLDYVLLSYAPSLWWLVVGRIIAGIAGSTMTAAHAYVADISSKEERAKSFGLLSAAMGLGFVLGPAIGGVLGTIDARMPFKAAAIIVGLTFLIGLFILPESLPADSRRSFEFRRGNPFGTLIQIRNHKKTGGLLMVLFFLLMAGQTYPSTWTFFTTEVFAWQPDEIGLSLMAFGALIVVVQGGLVGPIARRFGEVRTTYFGIVAGIASFAVMAFVTDSWLIYAAMPIMALGKLAEVGVKTLMSQGVPENAQGELQGATTGVISIVAIASPLMMTQIFGFFTGDDAVLYFPGAPFFVAGMIAVAAATLFMRNLTTVPGVQSEDTKSMTI